MGTVGYRILVMLTVVASLVLSIMAVGIRLQDHYANDANGNPILLKGSLK